MAGVPVAGFVRGGWMDLYQANSGERHTHLRYPLSHAQAWRISVKRQQPCTVWRIFIYSVCQHIMEEFTFDITAYK